MFCKFHKNKGQSALEYAILLAVVVAVLVIMNVYIKRGVQGRFKESSDDIGEQFDPGHQTYYSTTKSFSNVTESTVPNGTTIQDIKNQTTNRGVSTTTQSLNSTEWGVPTK